jgi:hypothetical protein
MLRPEKTQIQKQYTETTKSRDFVPYINGSYELMMASSIAYISEVEVYHHSLRM